MKKEIHPQYYNDSKISCACGQTFKVGSTKSEFKVDICSHCHPFYKGTQELIDTAGRVEKFKARRARAKIGARPQALGSKKKEPKSKA